MNIDTIEVIEKVNEAGWVIECFSPLEIRHEECESFATGIAAKFIIQAIMAGDEI